MEKSRYSALKALQNRLNSNYKLSEVSTTSIYGKNVFSLSKMRAYLAKEVYDDLEKVVEYGGTLKRGVADKIANAMKVWALEKGASHYTHWFQPLTGLTAEKHDAFFNLEGGIPIESFSGGNLAQQEPDASSLPSGGLRNTFEARGYTAWDPSSPAFIFENRYGKTLCIPTIFVSYNGEALDFKAPLLKSITVLEKAALDVCRLFDRSVKRVIPTLGAEQEYFLIDRSYFDLRPDLILCGRTLLGAPPARGQQLEDHYFGSIPERVFGFMNELETEAYKLGIPLKTRHNEVAPSQFECAPVFEEQNLAVDHNQLLIDLIDRIARKHFFRVLLHEKPFAGINGSGKHNNWSMMTDTGKNLLSPGKAPRENLQFLTFFACIVKAVHENADLLRAVIASAGNDHRLGANEAPPAIISVFIGKQLTEILDELEKPRRTQKTDGPKSYLKLGINKIPEILLDNTDRNRTSPFAFTGNKFEFRAVGSAANSAGPMTILNAIVANQLLEFKKTIDRKTTRGKKKEVAILEVIRKYVKESKPIRFEGNGYSDEWVTEAEKRGLSNIKKTPQALDVFVQPETKELFKKLGIFSEKELIARYEIRLERYIKEIQIEVETLQEIVLNQVVPVAIEYQTKLLQNIELRQKLSAKGKPGIQQRILQQLSASLKKIEENIELFREKAIHIQQLTTNRDIAIFYAENIIPIADHIRTAADHLEMIIPDQDWVLPKYREMLFNR